MVQWKILNHPLIFASNYAEGKTKQAENKKPNETGKRIEESLKTTNELIKDNEAKYGSDWKYTEDGKKLYEDYFKHQLSLAKENSDEYKEIQRQKWSYEKQLADKAKADADKAQKEADAKRKADSDKAKKSSRR